ncbi:MAG: cell division protein ZapA [Bacteroidia bacterium]|nr:cell division protein ZapA [Bacteroidia bacterium]
MEKHSIIITVFGRQFPAKVDTEEAAVIKDAAERINAKIKAFKAEYKNQDDLNIAIMCCLDIMTEFLSEKRKQETEFQTLLNEVSSLDEKLDQAIELVDNS